MTSTTFDLGPVAAAVTAVTAAVPDAALSGPTPCRDYRLGDELDHLMHLTVAFRLVAEQGIDTPEGRAELERESPPFTGSVDRLPPDWRDVLAGRLDALVTAWREPSAWRGTWTIPDGPVVPTSAAAQVLLGELAVHGWDVARATGQTLELDDASARILRAYFEDFATPGQSTGGFDAPVAVPDGASDLEHAVALSGRDPGWTP